MVKNVLSVSPRMCHSVWEQCVINKCQDTTKQAVVTASFHSLPPLLMCIKYFQWRVTEWVIHINSKLQLRKWKYALNHKWVMKWQVVFFYRQKDVCPTTVILPSDRAATRRRLWLLRGHSVLAATLHPLLPAGWLRSRGQSGQSAHRQTETCTDFRPEGGHHRAALSNCDLQAVLDKVATCAVRLFLTGEETPWKHDFMIRLLSKSKDNTFTRSMYRLMTSCCQHGWWSGYSFALLLALLLLIWQLF